MRDAGVDMADTLGGWRCRALCGGWPMVRPARTPRGRDGVSCAHYYGAQGGYVDG